MMSHTTEWLLVSVGWSGENRVCAFVYIPLFVAPIVDQPDDCLLMDPLSMTDTYDSNP